MAPQLGLAVAGSSGSVTCCAGLLILDVSCSCSALAVRGFACLLHLCMSFDNAVDDYGAFVKALFCLLLPFLATGSIVLQDFHRFLLQIFKCYTVFLLQGEKKYKYVLKQTFFFFSSDCFQICKYHTVVLNVFPLLWVTVYPGLGPVAVYGNAAFSMLPQL